MRGASEPEDSLGAARILEAAGAADAARLRAARETSPEPLARVVDAVGSVAPFLSHFLVRHPEAFFALLEDDLSVPRRPEDYASGIERALSGLSGGTGGGGTGGGDAVGDALRVYKYGELARICVRDACEQWVPEARSGETLTELSHLADALLAAACDAAAADLEARLGPPRWKGADGAERDLRFAVLGLGKLGGEELNFSSDVDLVYVYESPPEAARPLTSGPSDLSPEEYFSRLGRGFGALVATRSIEGFLYRVDLDLRPDLGGARPIAVSSGALAEYYDGWAATWEKAAFMKARPVAGHLAFGWEVVRSLDPMIYRSSMDAGAVAAIREMKERIEREKVGPEGEQAGAGFDVKLGGGGIRDVEFVAQALQLLHGGRIPQVRGRSTQEALRSLADTGVLPRDSADALLAAYRFLRRLENRMQMEAERQVHRVPQSEAGRRRLARALGIDGEDPCAGLEAAISAHRGEVRRAFQELFSDDEDGRILDLFARSAGRLLAVPITRTMLEGLAVRFARELRDSANPSRALVNLDRFIEGVGPRSFYWGLLLDRPELVPRLVALFAMSNFLSTVLSAQPQLIEPVFDDPHVLIPDRAQLAEHFEALHAELAQREGSDPVEVSLAALRQFLYRELVNVGLLDLGEKVDLVQVESGLTELAEVCLEKALPIAAGLARRRDTPEEPGQFLVVGMGKLGSRELTYGSDLDVIFLYQAARDDPADRLEAQQYFVRLAQKLGWLLQARTAEGVCYEVDARLRPSGNQGLLVTSLDAFRAYHEESAQVWERQALLRARAVAGSASLAEAFESLRREILCRPLPAGFGAEARRIRMRMETELAKESDGRRDFKTGRGGIADVETVVQIRQLEHGGAHPELFETARTDEQLERLAALGLLEADQAAALREGWSFLRRLSSRLRIVENRSISDLHAERGDLDAVARALGYPSSELTGDARRPLLTDYLRHTEAIRGVYGAALGGDGETGP